ncbi:MAG: flagellar basal-body MS-ring/collar protein FliF [Thiohalomonadaceae bacterium]
MELVKADNVTAPFEGFVNLPAVRQVGLMFGLAASVALGVAVVLWSQEPSYSVLYANLGSKDASQVMDALQKQGVRYRLDEKTGALMVPTSAVHELRLKLANDGLPHSSASGLDVLQQKQEFGTSQFLETARYQHALEGELARSVMTINSVEHARVHLALPKQTAFIRERQPPSASVLVSLYPGRTLEEAQVAAITHMVASSIPNLEPSRVTVVDQSGRLLSSKPPTNAAVNQEQFEYTRKLEESYIARIEDIIAPIVGMQGVRAQVSAEVDFTITEQTQESYNPDLPALRSEQVYEEKSTSEGAQGVPGALSNTPPVAATVPEVATGQPGGAAVAQSGRSLNRATKNYELDRTISHSKLATGQVRRLSVAVVVDDRQSVNQNGEVVREPRSAEEMERIAALVREAVGYNAQRGDTVNVINASFQTAQTVEPLPEPPLWKQPWVLDVGRQLLGVLVVILLLFGVLRPLLRALAAVKPPPAPVAEHGMSEDRLTLGGPGGVMQLSQHNTYEGNIAMIRDMARQDPKHVAQVVKTWVSGEEK